ncbi:stAR-related lipid transfer protein 7, mitochondrial-like isoform X2 [Biomphalaria glabrata]|nr:stAR-related lipid transfer protein 7, mitochondrial-like isoform X2 [Biomphalaria glabrata]XP_055872530.1 stAR-related lipid transfer protein 7, mitochondrial-like isoform X2 [Biomphalaria glabrata]XP_055872536.1 stAR-related lipid transfer protein 7, mitochondrial-like isoform X2 [Biomphalaria glabrata]XP_055872543.1 stAR-related lipid transfer protein 7, mitochondrial-like isoform X2 [Biomphalaria glabrata]XP_055872544.1 stAR-related lipid transfer protein 7, mitochondrial-like isoform X2
MALGSFFSKVTASQMLSTIIRRCVKSSFSGFTDGSAKFLLGQNAQEKMRLLINNIGIKLNLVSFLLTQQCNRVAALRLRRAFQIIVLYQRLYGEQVLMQKIKKNVGIKSKPLLAMLSAAVFQWEKERVTDDEIKKCCEEVQEVNNLIALKNKPNQVTNVSHVTHEDHEWVTVVDRIDFKIWRRAIPDSNLYQYRVFGKYNDIPARAFYNTQVDVEYWKDWDKNTIEVSIVDRDNKTESEVIHWIYKFPYPMYPRDYVYVRRCKVDTNAGTMVITARSTEHPSCPQTDACVRVSTYCSQIVIKPFTTFDENGFLYVQTYFDDPQTNFPPMCYNWMASTGVNEFLEKLYRAAKKKHEKSVESAVTHMDKKTGNIYTNIVHHQ